MADTKQPTRKTKSEKPNYVIIGKGGKIIIVSGETGEISALDKALSADVLKLVRARQKLGKELTVFLRNKGLILTDESSVDLEGGS